MIEFREIFEFPALFLKLKDYHTWNRMFHSKSCPLICFNFYRIYIYIILYIIYLFLYIVTPKVCFVCKFGLCILVMLSQSPNFDYCGVIIFLYIAVCDLCH